MVDACLHRRLAEWALHPNDRQLCEVPFSPCRNALLDLRSGSLCCGILLALVRLVNTGQIIGSASLALLLYVAGKALDGAELLKARQADRAGELFPDRANLCMETI